MKKTTLRLRWFVVSFLVYGSLLFECEVGAFNLDPFSVTVVRSSSVVNQPPSKSATDYFGYSHALLREDNATWLMVGAPRANVSWDLNILEPGTVYKCRLADDAMKTNLCNELRMDFESENQSPYISYEYNQWLGGAMDVSSTDGGQFVACGHRQTFTEAPGGKTYMDGVCFSRKGTKESTALKISARGLPTIISSWNPATKEYNRNVYRLPYAQWGFSIRSSTDGHVVMGGPGIWQWQGGLHVYFGPEQNCSIENATLTDSYLGYSVTEIRWHLIYPKRNPSRYLFAGGAPRYMEAGAVYVFEVVMPDRLHNNITCAFRTEQEIISQSYGSYFGASILAEDTNNDGVDELFIGAPYENLTLGDEGSVHYYVRNATVGHKFVKVKVLTGTKQGDARFGTAIASIGDLNFDGFKDVIIGSPMEDDGRGAIYIFNGSPSGIESHYSQRIAAVSLPELSSIKSFGHSLSTGRDVDGNKYPDVSIGAYMSDSVAIIRARPVHSVSVVIWFPESVISWQRPNCSKTSDDQSFTTPLIVSFYYTIPEEEKKNIKNTFILVDYKNRSAALGQNQRIILIDGQSSEQHPIQFIVVPCLAEPGSVLCVSFLAADRYATYMRLYDRNLYLHNMYTAKNSENYKKEASFILREDLANDKVVDVRSYALSNFRLVSDEHGNLTTRQMAESERPIESYFSFTRARYLSCMKDLSYELSIESESEIGGRRGYLLLPDGARSSSPSKESVDFTVENLEQPLNRSWKIRFPRYPKNIATPMKFRLNITGPSFTNNSRSSLVKASVDRVIFDELLPVLSRRGSKTFTGQIGFKKECGDDDVCHASLTVNMTLKKWGAHIRGLVIGSTKHLDLRFYIENSGEAAYSVRLEIVHPSVLPYSRLVLEDSCNQVTGTTFDMSVNGSSASAGNGSVVQGLNCDVENQIHTNVSIAFGVQLDTINFREASDFPKDVLELQCRVGTHGHIKNGTRIQSFEVPIRYEAQLEAFGTEISVPRKPTEPPVLEFNKDAAESKKSSDKTVTLKHEYRISNVDDKDGGPRGVMPSVVIDVLLPDDSILKVSKIVDVKVIVDGFRSSKKFERVVNGTQIISDDRPAAIATSTMNPAERNDTRTSTEAGQNSRSTAEAGQNNGNTAKKFQFARQTFFMHCATGPCSRIRRFNIGSMYVGDKVNVLITVQFSAVDLAALLKNPTSKLNYTSSIRLSPYSLSADVKKWREGNVDIVGTNMQTSTIIRPKQEPAGIPIWLILVGVAVGILHIVAVILILKKCGFFRRTTYMQMQDEMRENRASKMLLEDAEAEAEAEQTEATSQYDNELLREQMSVKSQSQYSAAGSYGNNGDEMKRSVSSTVDALHAQHPGVDFRTDE